MVGPDGSRFQTVDAAVQAVLNDLDDDDAMDEDSEKATAEKCYSIGQFHKKLAELHAPLQDGPILVVNFGSVVPTEGYFTTNAIYPVGYQTIAFYKNAHDQLFQFNCTIQRGDESKNSKGPIFVVQPAKSDIAFRSDAPLKAWKKAAQFVDELNDNEQKALRFNETIPTLQVENPDQLIGYMVSLPDQTRGNIVTIKQSNAGGNRYNVEIVFHAVREKRTVSTYSLDQLKSMVAAQFVALDPLSSDEDGFGLLRRNVSRVIEGLPNVLECDGFTFWGERHPFRIQKVENKLFYALDRLVGRTEAILYRNTIRVKEKWLNEEKKTKKRKMTGGIMRMTKRATKMIARGTKTITRAMAE